MDLHGPCYDPRVRRLARLILPVLFAGRTVGCPCCGGTFRRFVRRAGGKSLCPRCLSLGRHRSFWLFLSDRLDAAERRLKILHIAPEEGIAERLVSRTDISYVTADADPRSIASMTFDIMSIPFPPCSFDIVLCNHVLEHVEDDRVAMKELFRVLKPNGFLYSVHPVSFRLAKTIEDPTVVDPKERARVFGQRDHLRRYGRDFVDRLEEAGFEVELRKYEPPPEAVAFYDIKGQLIFVCRRPSEAAPQYDVHF